MNVPEEFIDSLERACNIFNIETEERQAAFLAQLAYESAGFTRLEENLNYTAGRLRQVFPKYFTADEADDFAGRPVRIAERVYGGRLGNGPEGAGDGWKYRGRGFIQLTGRGNYRKAGRALVLPLEDQPDLAAEPEHAATIAAWFWETEGCNELADDGKFDVITARISGSTRTLAARLSYLDAFRRAA